MVVSRHLICFVALVVVIFFTRLGSAKLWDRDEPRNARCACEMLERNDWIVPTFNGELRTHKPILLYWLTMASYLAFGVGEFGARFASAALAVGTTILTYLIGRRLFDSEIAFWSGIVLATTLMFNVAARAATPDSTLVFCGTLAICLYVYSIPRTAWRSDQATTDRSAFDVHSVWWAIAIFGAMGLGVLAKGPVGLVLPTAVIGMFLLLTRLPQSNHTSPEHASRPRRWRQWVVACLRPFGPRHFLKTCWHMRPLTAIAVVSAVALPWYLAVGIQTDGEWLRGFFMEHNVGRAMDSREGHHGSIWFYPVALLVGFFPWSVFALPVILWMRHSIQVPKDKQPITLLACWVCVYLFAFTLAQTKLPSYITPTYPAVALLTGSFISAYLRRLSDQSLATWWPAAAATCLTLVGVVLAIALPIAAHQLLPGDEWMGIVGGIPLLGGLLALVAIRRDQRRWAMASFSTAAIAFVLTLFAVVAPQVSRHQQIGRLVSERDSSSPRQIATYASHEPSWVFYAGQSLPFFRNGEFEQATKYLNGQPDHLLITTRDRYQELQPQLSTQIRILEEIPYFLRDQDLLLLGTPITTANNSDTISR